MKVDLFIDEKYTETKIAIYAKDYNHEVQKIQEILQEGNLNKISAFAKEEVKLLDCKDIVRFYSQDNKVVLETMSSTYTTRYKLYQLQDRLPKDKFIQISRFELVNLDYIDRLDLSFTGTLAIEFKNKQVSYVSRRFLKNFKQALGL